MNYRDDDQWVEDADLDAFLQDEPETQGFLDYVPWVLWVVLGTFALALGAALYLTFY